MIGELKKPHVIIKEEWNGDKTPGDKTKPLQREMRGYVRSLEINATNLLTRKERYAYHYNCHQVFVFDGVNLVLLQFKARDKEGIRMPGCAIDCCLIPLKSAMGQSTIQYALYRLAWRGWMRLSATLMDGGGGIRSSIPVTIGNIPRHYEGWSGKPFWEYQPGQYSFRHPQEWRREFVVDRGNGYWVWVSPDGRSVGGNDTGFCL